MRRPNLELVPGMKVSRLELVRLEGTGKERKWSCVCECGTPISKRHRDLKAWKLSGKPAGCVRCMRGR